MKPQLADDTRLCVRNALLAAGKHGVIRALKRGVLSLHSVHWEAAAIWTRDNVSVIEADVTCERLDASLTTFPVTLILHFRDGLIANIRVFTYEPDLINRFLQHAYELAWSGISGASYLPSSGQVQSCM